MAYLDNYLNQRSDRLRGRIVPKRDRPHLINQVMDLLEDFRSSPWEHEGSVRAGLRSALCWSGAGWQSADEESAGLIDAAFQKLGTPARLTWGEGQEGAADLAFVREQCRTCRGNLDEVAISRNEQFCGPECARTYITNSAVNSRRNGEKVATNAYRIIQKSRSEKRMCQQCGTAFGVVDPKLTNKFCSYRCMGASMRYWADRNCLVCEAVFKPYSETHMTCGPKCSARHRSDTVRHKRICVRCDATFEAKVGFAKFCSDRCRDMKTLTCRKFDEMFPQPVGYITKCGHCGCAFGSKRGTAKFCSDQCQKLSRPFSAPLTPRKFDWLMRQASS